MTLLAFTARAATIHVPADAPTIQAGVDLAAFGDTVEVACGTYPAGATLKDGIVVKSTTGLPNCATIDVTVGTFGFKATNLSQGVTVAGFRITSSLGNVRGMSIAGSRITLQDCELVDLGGFCNSGDGLEIFASSNVLVERCLFQDNSTGSCGEYQASGAAVLCFNSLLTMRECNIEANTAEGDGGALYLSSSSVTILDSNLASNEAQHNGKGEHAFGGAIYSESATPLTLERCTFHNNHGELGGGAIYSDGPATIVDCSFTENIATNAGAIYGNLTITNCIFEENAGVSILYGVVEITQSLFVRNQASSVIWAAFDLIDRCTFVANSRFGGGGEVIRLTSGSGVIRNSIIAFCEMMGTVNCLSGAVVTAECCDFYGNGGDWVLCVVGQGNANGNLSADPLFCDLDNGNYSLYSNSPWAPANSGGCGLIGLYDVACEPSSAEAKSWGGIKGLYR